MNNKLRTLAVVELIFALAGTSCRPADDAPKSIAVVPQEMGEPSADQELSPQLQLLPIAGNEAELHRLGILDDPNEIAGLDSNSEQNIALLLIYEPNQRLTLAGTKFIKSLDPAPTPRPLRPPTGAPKPFKGPSDLPRSPTVGPQGNLPTIAPKIAPNQSFDMSMKEVQVPREVGKLLDGVGPEHVAARDLGRSFLDSGRIKVNQIGDTWKIEIDAGSHKAAGSVSGKTFGDDLSQGAAVRGRVEGLDDSGLIVERVKFEFEAQGSIPKQIVEQLQTNPSGIAKLLEKSDYDFKMRGEIRNRQGPFTTTMKASNLPAGEAPGKLQHFKPNKIALLAEHKGSWEFFQKNPKAGADGEPNYVVIGTLKTYGAYTPTRGQNFPTK